MLLSATRDDDPVSTLSKLLSAAEMADGDLDLQNWIASTAEQCSVPHHYYWDEDD